MGFMGQKRAKPFPPGSGPTVYLRRGCWGITRLVHSNSSSPTLRHVRRNKKPKIAKTKPERQQRKRNGSNSCCVRSTKNRPERKQTDRSKSVTVRSKKL